MRVVKIFSSIVFGGIIILAIGGYFFVRNFDLNKYKVYVEEYAKQYTGRELKINGEAKVALSLIPTIVVNDVELANSSWAANPQMIKIKRAEVKISLMPLLEKRVVIDKIILLEPEIYLEKSAQGEANWDFGSKTAKVSDVKTTQLAKALPVQVKAPVAAVALGFAAKNVSIQKGIVEYYDANNNSLQRVAINDISFSVPNENAQMNVNFDVLYNQDEIKGSFEGGSLAQLLNGTDNFPFNLDINALGIKADIEGGIVDMVNNPQYAVLVNVYNPAGNLNAPETTLKARIDGNLQSLKAQIENLDVINNVITGTAEINWSGAKPTIVADLQSPKIDITKFSSKNNFAFELPSIVSEAHALAMVPNELIPYDLLYVADADVKANIGNLVFAQGLSANNVTVVASLKNGKLVLNPLDFDFGGGRLIAQATIDAAAKTLTLKANSKDMLLQNLYNEFAVVGNNDFGIKNGGQTDIDINLKGSGSTYRQMAESLSGQAIVIVGKSVIQSGRLEFLRSNFINQLLGVLNIADAKIKDVDLTCAVLRADLGGGKIKFPKGIAVDSEQITLMSDGKINMINDDIEFTIEPSMNRLASGNIAQALASFIKVVGTLQNPKIRIDNKETLKTVVGIMATGGMSYLGSQVLLNGSGEPCYVALQGTPYASRFPKPTGVKATTQGVYNDTSKQIKKGLKDLENTAKDLLNMFKNK